MTSKEIFRARQIRNAEVADPGVVRRVLAEKLDAGGEPSRAAINRRIAATAKPPQPNRRDVFAKGEAARLRFNDLEIVNAIRALACLFRRDEAAMLARLAALAKANEGLRADIDVMRL